MPPISRRQSLAGLSLALGLGASRQAAPVPHALQDRGRTTDPSRVPTPHGTVAYKTQKVGPVDVFYREAGPRAAPVILLLHGFPTTSHMFRDLIPQLATRYRVIAPDLPSFGLTKAPPRGQFDYTFANLTKTMERFTEALGLTRYALYVFDYGAPVGFRLATLHPERVNAIISQNGNPQGPELTARLARTARLDRSRPAGRRRSATVTTGPVGAACFPTLMRRAAAAAGGEQKRRSGATGPPKLSIGAGELDGFVAD